MIYTKEMWKPGRILGKYNKRKGAVLWHKKQTRLRFVEYMRFLRKNKAQPIIKEKTRAGLLWSVWTLYKG